MPAAIPFVVSAFAGLMRLLAPGSPWAQLDPSEFDPYGPSEPLTPDEEAALAAFGLMFFGLAFVLWVVTIVGKAMVFKKAGQPSWAAIVPIYNRYVTVKIVNRPGWWTVLFYLPLIQLVVAILVSLDLARAFGKTEGYGVGLALLPVVFYPMLGFGQAQFQPSAVPAR